MSNKWLFNIAKKIIIQNNFSDDKTTIVTLYTSNSEIIKKIFNIDIILKDNELYNINHNKVESFENIDNFSISLPLIPFELSPSELMQDKEDEKTKSYEFQNYLIEFVKNNLNSFKDNIFAEKEIASLEEALLFLDIPYEEVKMSYICKPVLNLVVKIYNDSLKKIIDKYLPSANYELPVVELIKNAMFNILEEEISNKQKDLLEEKKTTLENARHNNLNLFLPDVENHYEELNKRLVEFNYRKIINVFQTIPELFYFWPPWLNKPDFLENKKTTTLNELKILLCSIKLGMLDYYTLGADELNSKIKEYFINKANIKKKNLLLELDNYIANDPNTKELQELKNNIETLDIDKEFQDKDTTYSILLHWPELLFPEPLEIKECKDLLFDNLEIISNV